MTDPGDDVTLTEADIAQVLRGHRYMTLNAGGRTGCRGCTWNAKGPAQSERSRREHEAHVGAIVAARVASLTADRDKWRGIAAALTQQGER